jgi:hypothetical protein
LTPQALPRPEASFEFGGIEPTVMGGHVVDFEPALQAVARLGSEAGVSDFSQ